MDAAQQQQEHTTELGTTEEEEESRAGNNRGNMFVVVGLCLLWLLRVTLFRSFSSQPHEASPRVKLPLELSKGN